MLSPESPIFVSIGDYSLRYYSIMMFFSILFGSLLSVFIAKKYYEEIDLNSILDVLSVVIISGILGARLYYVLLDFDFYFKYPLEILAIYKGGLSIHGAIIGGFVAGIIYMKKHKLNLWKYADIFSYGLLLGQIIGRLGNYFNVEAFGKPCNFSNIICLNIPEKYRPVEYLNNEYFHPTFLYEMLWNIFVLFVLFFFIRKMVKNTNGIVFFCYLILYSVGRFFIEGVRSDSVLNINGIHIAQIVSLLIICFSIFMICKFKKSMNET